MTDPAPVLRHRSRQVDERRHGFSGQSPPARSRFADPDGSSRHGGENQRYVNDFHASVACTSLAVQLYEKMVEFHPNRINPSLR